MKKPARFWVVDYETLVNCIVIVALDQYSEEKKVFVIHQWLRDDRVGFVQFLIECQQTDSWHVTFNGVNFDCQLNEYILDYTNEWLSNDAEFFIFNVYSMAQRVIDLKNRREWLPYKEYEFRIKTVDVFKLNHWDSPAKMAGLKWIEFSMDWRNIEENPFNHWDRIENWEDLKKLVWYCINDCKATRAIIEHQDDDGKFVTKDQINLRYELSKHYNLCLYSASEPKLSRDIFLHILAEKLRMKKWDLREKRTPRTNIQIAPIILPCVNFKTPEFQGVLDWFRSLDIPVSELDEDFDSDTGKTKHKGPKYSMTYQGVVSDYGLGGIHGCVRPGIYVPGPDEVLKSADVTSFYPMLAIVNGWAPAHLPAKEFCELYLWMFNERAKHAKGSAMNYVMKILLNATYGLSKNKHAFLYDPEFTFRITVNGQLLLSMLYEEVMLRIPGARAIMQNTDGMEVIIPKAYEALYDQICSEWMDMTKLGLDFVDYQKMIIRDVNNYIAVSTKSEIKAKGMFEYKNLALHKNKSMLVVPKALHAYFLEGVKPQDYLAQNSNIFDYCSGVKLRGDWFFNELKTEPSLPEQLQGYTDEQKQDYLLQHGWVQNESNQELWLRKAWLTHCQYPQPTEGLSTEYAFNTEAIKSSDIVTVKHKKLIRYYVSKRGSKLIKTNPDGRQNQLDAGNWYQTIYNVHYEKPIDEYNLDMRYYRNAIQKEIDSIELGQVKGTKGRKSKHGAENNRLQLKMEFS